MGMWEIEVLVKESIQLVDETALDSSVKVNLIWNLYQVQKGYDCGFTHFRVMDILIKNGYTKAVDISAHPEYENQATFFKQLVEKDFAFLYEQLLEPRGKNNQKVAYWEQERAKLFIDCDSPLWVEDKPILEPISVSDLGLLLIREAHKQKNSFIIYHWTAFLVMFVRFFFKPHNSTEEEREGMERNLTKIKKVFDQYDFEDYEPMHRNFEIREAW